MNKKQKNKMHDLKVRLAETRRVENLHTIKKSQNKADIKTIKKANKSPKGERDVKNSEGNIIDLEQVSKTYVTGKQKFTAINNVSFTVRKGEFVVILGPSGSGKTSLLNVLSGLDRPTSGRIIVDDVNISALKNDELTTFRRNLIGFIFQNYNLLTELNAQDNAEMGRQLQTDNNKRISIDKLFRRLGLEGSEKQPVTNLSGGQAQRVSIIRAISKNPKLLVADEPTGALDSVASQKIIDLFWDINKKFGTTIVLVTHNEKYVKHATKVVRVDDGKVTVHEKTITK